MCDTERIVYTHFGRDTYEVVIRIEDNRFGRKAEVRILGPDQNARLLLDPDAERYTFKHCWAISPWGLWHYTGNGGGRMDPDVYEAFGAALADEEWRERLDGELERAAADYVPGTGHGRRHGG